MVSLPALLVILAAAAPLPPGVAFEPGFTAIANSAWEHGYLLDYGPGPERVKIRDFQAGLLELTARDGGDEAARDVATMRAELAVEGHVYRIELTDPPPPVPTVAFDPRVEMKEVRAARKEEEDFPVSKLKSPVVAKTSVFGLLGSAEYKLPPAVASIAVQKQARVWRDGTVIATGVPAQVYLLERGIVARGRAPEVVPPAAETEREVHVIIDGLPVRKTKASRLHAVFDKVDVTISEVEK